MTEQDPLVPPEDEALPLEDRLSEAALAAVMGDPYEVGLRIALDDGVAAALPGVARELAWLDRAVAATQGRLAGLAAAPVAGVPAATAVAGTETAEVAPVAAAVAPSATEAPSGLGAIAAAGARLLPVDRAAARAAVVTAVPAVAAPADGGSVTDESGPGFGRLDWGGVDWGRLAAPPSISVPAAPVPSAMEQGASSPAAGAEVGWPAWSAAPQGDMAVPSAAPDAAVIAPAEEGGFAGFAGHRAAMPGQASRDEVSEAGAGEAADSESGRFGGVLEVDGALLGRFIAEQLGRAADRPPSGMTGFDPLVSPAWMSASVG